MLTKANDIRISSRTPKNAHPHKFRSTFLTRLLRSGCDSANVQALAGHKSTKTTQHYLGVSTQLRREAVNRLKLPELELAE